MLWDLEAMLEAALAEPCSDDHPRSWPRPVRVCAIPRANDATEAVTALPTAPTGTGGKLRLRHARAQAAARLPHHLAPRIARVVERRGDECGEVVRGHQ